MKALDSITTGQWSNIPPCIVQSINILVEQLKNQGLQSESLKSQVLDLSVKFSAKTSKIESSFEEFQGNYQANKVSTNEKIKDLDQAIKFNSEGIDKVTRNLGSSFNELKARINHLVSENKKSAKETEKRSEMMNEQVLETIQARTEKSKIELEESLKDFINKYVIFARDIEEILGKTKDKQEEFQSKLESIYEKIHFQSVVLELNEKTMKSANETLSRLVFRNQKNKTSIRDLSRKVEDIVNRPQSPLSSNRSEPCPQISEFHPWTERIEKLDHKLEKTENDLKNSIESLNLMLHHLIRSAETDIKLWAKEQITKDLIEYMGDAKKKLDWIPNGSESIKGMSVSEARIFILEARIRQEENMRITCIQNLENEIKAFQRPRSVSSHKKSKSSYTPVEDRVVNFHKVKVVSKRPSSSLGYRDFKNLGITGLRDKFKIKVNDLIL